MPLSSHCQARSSQYPQHPYTQALITAIPSFESKPKPIPLAGELCGPLNPDPNICRLYGRCEHATERCSREMPMLQKNRPDHVVACHYPLRGSQWAKKQKEHWLAQPKED